MLASLQEHELAPRSVPPLVWLLLGNRQGDDNQLRALAEALGFPYETKRITYNRLRHIASLRGQRLLYLTREARAQLHPPWPDLVVGVGYDSVPIARHVRQMSGGLTRLVQIGNPRTTTDDIDLVIATPQYCLRPAPNLLALPFPIGNPARTTAPTGDEVRWLEAMPRPRRLVAVGGATRQWKIARSKLDRAVEYLRQERAGSGGSVIAAMSRRTPSEITRSLAKRLSGPGEACVESFPRFGVLLANCDEFHVTADSVSMLAEAILTGKPVGMIPIDRSLRGRVGHFLRGLGLNLRFNADLSRFWDYLLANRLIGTVESPVASNVSDTTGTAVQAVRNLLARPPGLALLQRTQV